MTGTDLTIRNQAPGVKPVILSVLSPHSSEYWSSVKSLQALAANGVELESELALALRSARLAIAPVEHNRLTDRLTALGMMMSPNRPPAEASVWLGEMARLLKDLPEDLLSLAIDECVKTTRFLPTCSEIRERCEGELDRRQRIVRQIETMVRYLESGQAVPRLAPPAPQEKRAPDRPMTAAEAEEMNAILSRLNLSTRYRGDGSRYETESKQEAKRVERGRPQMPTRQDYIDMGVAPAVLDQIAAEKAA